MTTNTERLYYDNPYLREWEADVIGASGDLVYLDRTAFYPASGGQPFDLGTIADAHILEVIDEGAAIAHRLNKPVPAGTVTATLDWVRRFDHMQQHTGQHLLSAVFAELYGFQTLSFHMGTEVSTIELSTAVLENIQTVAAERLANELVADNRSVMVSYEDSESASGLRKASGRTGTLRIVSIYGLDRTACGGTHVRNTGEIGAILVRKLDRVRSNVRIEFVCGLRAIARARADFDSLTAISRAFSCALDEAPRIAAANVEKLQDLDKSRRKMAAEMAMLEGQALHSSTPAAAPDGIRRAVRRAPINEESRVFAQAFTAGGQAILLQISEDPPSVLLAASKDANCNCGELLKKALAEAGGRGGGSPVSAQGSVPTREALALVEARIVNQWLS